MCDTDFFYRATARRLQHEAIRIIYMFGCMSDACTVTKPMNLLSIFSYYRSVSQVFWHRAARVVLNAPPRTPSLPLLRQLHWLPTEARISYKLCSLMYRVSHESAPTYLTELCQLCSDTRLRSTSRGDFIVPQSNRQLSNSSFSVAAPSAWNRLPLHIRTSPTYTLFLSRLKTHLFAESLPYDTIR